MNVIFDRFIIHYFSAGGIFLHAWWLMSVLKDWEPGWVRRSRHVLVRALFAYLRKAAGFLYQHRVVLALVLLLPLGIWEYTNLEHGQSYLKGFFDFASWPLGYASVLWILKLWRKV